MPKFLIEKLVSGGQTGADRAALDAAIALGIPHGGWCPRGRKAEDGRIPDRYLLTETPGANYLQRTEWNVRDSDGTAVFTIAEEASGGSKKTIQFARRLKKPYLHIARDAGGDAAQQLREFIAAHGIRALNVAGSRESKEPGIGAWVGEVLRGALAARLGRETGGQHAKREEAGDRIRSPRKETGGSGHPDEGCAGKRVHPCDYDWLMAAKRDGNPPCCRVGRAWLLG